MPVIPAQAGIHPGPGFPGSDAEQMDPRLRGDDEQDSDFTRIGVE
jgi:hypothetical protein